MPVPWFTCSGDVWSQASPSADTTSSISTLTLGFANAGARDSFDNGGSSEIVRQAAIDVVGHDWRVETIVDPGADPETRSPAGPPGPEASSTPTPSAERGRSGPPDRAGAEPSASADPDEGARHDDTDAESAGLDGTQLLQGALGAQVIDGIPHQ